MSGNGAWMILIRFLTNLAGVTMLFLSGSSLRFGRKKTMLCYVCFGLFLIPALCVRYVPDGVRCLKLAASVLYIVFSVFSVCMSGDPMDLSVYRFAVAVYFLTVFQIGGIEVSAAFFNGNGWVDNILPIVLTLVMAYWIRGRTKPLIQGFAHLAESETDRLSLVILIVSIVSGIAYMLHPAAPCRLLRVFISVCLTGSLQFLVFRLYLHIGKEKAYQRENQLIQMNHRLLEKNVELLEDAVRAGDRIRHDVRHHNAVIGEYVRRGQNREVLQYLKEYEREMDVGNIKSICANTVVNNILSAYTRRAEMARIEVSLDVELGRDVDIPGIDLVAILANVYENAIFGCMEVQKQSTERVCFIHLMLRKRQNKLVIRCSNTCSMEAALTGGQGKRGLAGGIGVLSITRTADKYNGEYDFRNDNGVFVFRLIMNIPQALRREK